MFDQQQFEQLLTALTALKPKGSWWRKTVDATVAGLLMSLVLGFFAQIWTTATGWRDSLDKLDQQTRVQTQEIRSTQDVLSRELAQYQLKVDRLHDGFETLIQRLEETMDSPMPLAALPPPDEPSEAVERESEIKGQIREDVEQSPLQAAP